MVNMNISAIGKIRIAKTKKGFMTKRVLVVDDDVNILNMLVLIARTIGVLIDSASSGKEAVIKLQKGRYWKMITDFDMPGMDGITLARLARIHAPGVEVVMITGSVISTLPENAALAGVSRVVDKPVSIELIIELLKQPEKGADL